MTPILLVGLPRSGTTWIANVLGNAHAVQLLLEPDNEKSSPMAWAGKNGIHRFPYLAVGDKQAAYATLWETILQGDDWLFDVNYRLSKWWFRGKIAGMEAAIGDKVGFCYRDTNYRHIVVPPVVYGADQQVLMAKMAGLLLRGAGSPKKRRIVKSVHTPLAMGWLAAQFPLKMVVVLRNPFSLYASYKRMAMPDGFRNIGLQRGTGQFLPQAVPSPQSFAENVVCQTLWMTKIMAEQIAGDWVVVSHDEICRHPQTHFQALFAQLGLTWTAEAEQHLTASNQSGKGFMAQRQTALQPTKWQKELSGAEIEMIRGYISAFQLENFLKTYQILGE
jgi:hypothetical protein